METAGGVWVGGCCGGLFGKAHTTVHVIECPGEKEGTCGGRGEFNEREGSEGKREKWVKRQSRRGVCMFVPVG